MRSVAIILFFGIFCTAFGEAQEQADPLARIRALHERLKLAPRDSYLNYAIAAIARREGIDLKKEGIPFPLVPIVTDQPARRVDLFGLTTGMVALHESLQLSEIFSTRTAPESGDVPIESLGAPDLPSLDFEKRLEEEKGKGREPIPDPEACLVPGDWLYLRFATGKDLLAFILEADHWAAHVLNFYGSGARKSDMVFKPFFRLGMVDPRKHPELYEALPGPLTIAVSDLFFMEGTDVTVVLPEQVPSFLFIETPSRVKGEAGGRVVLSTSKRALQRVCEVIRTKEGSIAQGADYRLMRSLLPAGKDEAVFAFLSEAFLRRLVGPKLRVLESRRVRCASHLRTLTNACLLFLEEKGGKPERLDELFEEKYVKKEKMTCPHGGSYGLEGGMKAFCSVHNRLECLTPHIELDLEKVKEEEASAYKRFSRSYGNYWRRYFDPVGISMERNGRSWSIDLFALPLAENSLYRNLASVAGGLSLTGETSLTAPSTVLQVTSKVDRSFLKDLEAWIERWDLIPDEEERKALFGAFGGHASLGLLDRTMLFDFDMPEFLGEAVQWNASEEVFLAPLIAGANLPAYAVIPIRDQKKAQTFLSALERGLLIRGRKPEGGSFSLKIESYAIKGMPFESRAVTLELFSFKFRLFYTLTDAFLVMGTKPDTLEKVVNGEAITDSGRPFNMKLSIYPGRWRAMEKDMLLEYEEGARKSCLRFLTELQPYAALSIPDPGGLLGTTFACPDQGSYTLNGNGTLACTIHGTSAKPLQHAGPSPSNGISKILKNLEEISFSLRFIKNGIHSTVRIKRTN